VISFNFIDKGSEKFETVERKGIGHPDTLCDAIAEKTSQLYSRYCLETFGKLCHHWFDKVLLIGGESDFSFGKGSITKPYEIHLMGKCVKMVGKHEIPVESIFNKACNEVLSSILTDFIFQEQCRVFLHVTDYQGPENISVRYRPNYISDLVNINDDLGKQISNDCNICVGYYPYSVCEEAVLKSEQYLNNKKYKSIHPEIGCDIKVFGRRIDTEIDLLIRLPFVAKYTPNKQFYDSRIKEIKQELIEVVHGINEKYNFKIRVNEGDSPEDAYLTVTGTVADTGDVGCVGRGNRINGLITPARPQSIEAASGKNPIDHTGKIYSILAKELAKEIYSITDSYTEVYLNSMKHKRLDDPDSVIIQTNKVLTELEKESVKEIIDRKMRSCSQTTKSIIFGDEHLW